MTIKKIKHVSYDETLYCVIVSLWITGSHGSGNTVVSPMGIVNGKAEILDRCISETAEGNSTKIGTGNYVVAKFMCAKFRRVFPRRIPNMFILRWHLFFYFLFWFHQSGYIQPKPLNRFWRFIRQKNRFGPRRCLWGVNKFPKKNFTPKMVKNPLSHAFQWET